jgi:UDP-glucose 4-epimerase
MPTILITGGTGFIGSHFAVEAISQGYDVVLIDNLANSSLHSLDSIAKITGVTVPFHEVDVRDTSKLTSVFKKYSFDSVVHFAALKSVPNSIKEPLEYESNNVGGTINLLECMQDAGVFKFVFSSSATVYGDPSSVPIPESAPTSYTNPYGHTKLVIEQICQQLAAADPRWHVTLLRYFNPVGAHPSGVLGEIPRGVPGNLMPNILNAASGVTPTLMVTGNDYPTPDGTGIRDYIHIMDLVEAHVATLRKLQDMPGCTALNLGTGFGISVLEIVSMVEEVSGRKISINFIPRRPGDIAECYADPSLAQTTLEWVARRDLREMCSDAWNFHSQNSDGNKKPA